MATSLEGSQNECRLNQFLPYFY